MFVSTAEIIYNVVQMQSIGCWWRYCVFWEREKFRVCITEPPMESSQHKNQYVTYSPETHHGTCMLKSKWMSQGLIRSSILSQLLSREAHYTGHTLGQDGKQFWWTPLDILPWPSNGKSFGQKKIHMMFKGTPSSAEKSDTDHLKVKVLPITGHWGPEGE